MLVNRVITMIFCNHTTGKKKIDSDGYKQLKDELTSYLKNGDQDIITAFDYGIKRNDMEVCNLDKYPYQDNSVVKNGTLNSMESNLVRLCCHLLLKAEWNIWTN